MLTYALCWFLLEHYKPFKDFTRYDCGMQCTIIVDLNLEAALAQNIEDLVHRIPIHPVGSRSPGNSSTRMRLYLFYRFTEYKRVNALEPHLIRSSHLLVLASRSSNLLVLASSGRTAEKAISWSTLCEFGDETSRPLAQKGCGSGAASPRSFPVSHG